MTQSELNPEILNTLFDWVGSETPEEVEKQIASFEEEMAEDLENLSGELTEWEREQCWARAKRLVLFVKEKIEPLGENQSIEDLPEELTQSLMALEDENSQTPLTNPEGEAVEVTERHRQWIFEYFKEQQFFKEPEALEMGKKHVIDYFKETGDTTFYLSRCLYAFAKLKLAIVQAKAQKE